MDLKETFLGYACPQRPLSWRAATTVLHSCLFLASFRMVPQMWFRVFISTSTVRRQVFFGLPLLRFLSGVQCRDVRVMSPRSFLSTCPIHLHLLLMLMVSMLSWRQRANSCSFEMVLSQKILRILLGLFRWKTERLRSLAVILKNSEPYNRIERTHLWYSFSLVFVLYLWDLQTLLNILKAFLAFLKRFFTLLPAPPSHLTVLPRPVNSSVVGRSSPFTSTGGGVWDVECNHFCLLLADLQAYIYYTELCWWVWETKVRSSTKSRSLSGF